MVIRPANSGKEKLTVENVMYFNQFLLKMIELNYKRKITPLYRGDKMKNLHDRLGVYFDEDRIDYDQLLERLFMLGEKARNFYSQEFYKPIRSRQFRIDDTDEGIFNYIFESLRSSTKSKNPVTIDFFVKNSTFKNFFLDKNSNKKPFVDQVLKLNINDQYLIRNYYLTLLHQLGSINHKELSIHISTSTDYKVAEKFSKSYVSGKSIVIHAWKPNFNTSTRIKHLKLPTYKGQPYKIQKEISLLAGILPHYIIGLQVVEDNKFYINPNIFSNPINSNTFLNGLEINQNDFNEILFLSNYDSSFESTGKFIYSKSLD